eukprot:1337974-Amorphochlora_amoeboformis.AAC.3
MGYVGVIMMRSANTEAEDKKQYYAAGADGVIPKSHTSAAIAKMVIEEIRTGNSSRRKKVDQTVKLRNVEEQRRLII